MDYKIKYHSMVLVILAIIWLVLQVLNVSNGAAVKNCGIVGAFIFPHGGITLHPETKDFSTVSASGLNSQEDSIKLHQALKKAAADIVKTRPDVIVLSTPHGLFLQDHILFLGNPSAYGYAEDNFTAQFNLDKASTETLVTSLKEAGNPVETLYLGIGYDAMPIRWGEVIPWTFVNSAYEEAGLDPPPVIYIGQKPDHDVALLLKLGKDMATAFLTLDTFKDKRILILISGDLSHYHSNNPTSPYKFHPSAPVFDSLIVQWAKKDMILDNLPDIHGLIAEKANEQASTAGSCGYTGHLMLHGLLQEAVRQNKRFKAHFYEYRVPTYFGMTVAGWLPF